jgi:hypothetical protein
MRRTRFIGAALAGALALSATPARADFNLAIGMKWAPLNYTHPVSAAAGGGGPMSVDLKGFQTTSLDNYFGAFFLNGRLGFQLSLDIGYGSRHTETTTGAMTVTGDQSFTQFGFAIGGKFYITQPRRERVSPYVYLDFYKYFAAVSTTDKSIPNDQAGFIAGLVSPLGFNAAFGAEYFFTPAFSIGGEVLGLKYGYTEGDYSLTGAGFGDTKVLVKQNTISFYTGISLNYRFLISASVRVRSEEGEGDEQPTPRRRHKRENEEGPSPDAPPASPESVD